MLIIFLKPREICYKWLKFHTKWFKLTTFFFNLKNASFFLTNPLDKKIYYLTELVCKPRMNFIRPYQLRWCSRL